MLGVTLASAKLKRRIGLKSGAYGIRPCPVGRALGLQPGPDTEHGGAMMGWNEQVFRYCERGLDPSFWAEPVNALSNTGFLVVAMITAGRVRQLPTSVLPADRAALMSLAGLIAAIGIGSFLFHTFATRWSRTVDVAPIGLFMLVYLAFTLRMLMGLGWTATVGILGGFLVITAIVSSFACPTWRLTAVTDAAREPCLKGSIGYVPALVALGVTGFLLRQRHPAGQQLLLAGGLFLAAIILRWLDRDLCTATRLLGAVRGTHALWHLLNAGTLYVLMSAALLAVTRPPHRRAQ